MSKRTVPSCGGLPPLARGARGEIRETHTRQRSTPARAGSTAAPRSTSAPIPVYPRSRGEHSVPRSNAGAGLGLPPLARGALVTFMASSVEQGSTPARAGSTMGSHPCGSGFRVYPRSRGEHFIERAGTSSPAGLPPLARGARQRTSPRRPSPWSTPARAGSTDLPLGYAQLAKVYPRSRGEHPAPTRYVGTCDGLPPLARGALFLLSDDPTSNSEFTKNATGSIRVHLRPVLPSESTSRSAALHAR